MICCQDFTSLLGIDKRSITCDFESFLVCCSKITKHYLSGLSKFFLRIVPWIVYAWIGLPKTFCICWNLRYHYSFVISALYIYMNLKIMLKQLFTSILICLDEIILNFTFPYVLWWNDPFYILLNLKFQQWIEWYKFYILILLLST